MIWWWYGKHILHHQSGQRNNCRVKVHWFWFLKCKYWFRVPLLLVKLSFISTYSTINPFSCVHLISILTQSSLLCRSKTGFAIAINLMYGMASLSSTFALLLVTESSIKSKHVQQVSGVYLSNFWFSALVWDLVNFLLPCILMLVSRTSIQD